MEITDYKINPIEELKQNDTKIEKYIKKTALLKEDKSLRTSLKLIIEGFTLLEERNMIQSMMKTRALGIVMRDDLIRKNKRNG